MAGKHYLEQFDNGDPTFKVEDGKIHDSELNEEQTLQIQQLIGEVVFRFNELETDLDRVIAEIINSRSHQPGYAITAEVGSIFTKKVLIFKSLYGQMVYAFENEEFTREYEALLTSLFTLKDVRNDVAHANWSGISSTYEVRLRINADERGPFAISKEMSPEYLVNKIELLEAAITNLEVFDGHRDQMFAHGRILKEEDYKNQ